MKNELSRYGEGFFDPFLDLFAPANFQENNKYAKGLQMKTDIVDLPGIDKQNIHVSLNDGYLTVEAKVEENQNNNGNEKYIHKERFTGVSSRSYYVGDVDENDVSAKYENGVLKLFVPKEVPESKKEHHIAIE